MRTKQLSILLALVVLLAPAAAFAGGPLLVFDPDTNTPYAWGTTAPVSVYTDLGDLGPLANATADGQVQFAIAQWQAVATATLALDNVGDFALAGLPDVNDAATAGQVIGVFNNGGIHVVYDSTGDVIFDFFGAPPGVLGIASPDFATGAEITEGWVVLNGSTIDAGDTNGDFWTGVITHELGHSINLAHTQTNGAVGFYGDASTPDGCPGPYDGASLFIDDLETMYPFIDPTPGTGSGVAQKTIDHLDDVAALSDLYPATGWPSAYASIGGRVLAADGVTEVSGINVIVRQVSDPFAQSNSQLSGNRSQDAATTGPKGDFLFNGLTPGEDYVVYIDGIVAGGFSTTPTGLTFDEEWWNTAESADGSLDPVCDYSVITAAGTFTADIILTDPGAVLTLGDDDSIEVPLGFNFPFCDGNVYDTVWVNSNGNLTFGAGSTDYSESIADLLAGPARIAPLWDDLSPNESGIVTAENVGGEFVVVFQDVPQFFGGDSNNFTVTLRPDGTYSIEYGAISTTDALIGRSAGNGVADPGGVDLSAAAQPIGFGEQTVYELFSFVPIDLGGQTYEWTVCELLPAPILGVDVTPVEVNVVVDGTDTAQLDISNVAIAPAQVLEWSVEAAGSSPKIAPSSGEIRLFEPATAVWHNGAAKVAVGSGTPHKHADARQRLESGSRPADSLQLLKAAGPNAVADGSFEAGAFGGVWNEFSSNFGTPICDTFSCGTGTGTGPRTGSFWTWFGGIGASETGSVSQSVVIPTGAVTLSFWIEQIICDSPSDFMSVRIDGNEVYRTDGSSAICGQLGYTEVVVDLAGLGYADGAAHDVEFYSEIFAVNGSGSNFFVDDVVIAEQIPTCDFLTLSPTTGATVAGSSDPVTLGFDATGLAPGVYNCTITVASNGGTASVPVAMTVVEPFVDGTLQLTSTELADACSDGYFYTTLVPPAGVSPASIVVSDVLLNDSLVPDPSYSELVDLSGDGNPDALVVRFDCNDVSRLIGCGDDLAVVVTSNLNDGTSSVGVRFAGTINNGAVFPVAFGDSWDNISLQEILDAEFGVGAINAETDYEGALCGDAITPYWFDDLVEGWIVREVAGFQNHNIMGWYKETFSPPTIDGVDDGVVFVGFDGEGATAILNLPGVVRFGLYLNPRGELDAPNAPEPEVHFTNRRYNDEGPDGSGSVHAPSGGDPQALIYNVTALRGGVPTYIVAWEDLDSGAEITPDYDPFATDNDYNDLVVEIRATSPVSAVTASLSGEFSADGMRLHWELLGADEVDALEVHRTDPSGRNSVAARWESPNIPDIGDWTDTKADEAGTYRYRLEAQVDSRIVRSGEVTLEKATPNLVNRSQLTAAVPNPFNPKTEVQFALSRSEDVTISIFDLSGRRVREVRMGTLDAGTHTMAWDGTDAGGARVSSGVYLIRMVTPTVTDGLRVVLVK